MQLPLPTLLQICLVLPLRRAASAALRVLIPAGRHIACDNCRTLDEMLTASSILVQSASTRTHCSRYPPAVFERSSVFICNVHPLTTSFQGVPYCFLCVSECARTSPDHISDLELPRDLSAHIAHLFFEIKS